jgi:hypothetical protein
MNGRPGPFVRISRQIDWLDVLFMLALCIVCAGFYFVAPMAFRFPAPAMSHSSSQSSPSFSVDAPSNAPNGDQRRDETDHAHD